MRTGEPRARRAQHRDHERAIEGRRDGVRRRVARQEQCKYRGGDAQQPDMRQDETLAMRANDACR